MSTYPIPRRIAEILRTETIGGMLLLGATVVALAWANSHGETAVPTATDIAFALAVLAVISTHLPAAMRTFLLTLAVVDDLLAILVIAVFYTSTVHPLPLLGATLGVAAFGLLVQRGRAHWWLLLPLAAATWAFTHASGVHATVAGVALAFTVPVNGPGGITPAERFEHTWRPISAGFAVPVFAFFASGVTIGGSAGAVTVAVAVALVAGKPIGITAATWLVQRFTRARLADGLNRWDVLGLGLLAGIGFTVSLLISELAFGAGSALDDQSKLGVLAGSLLSALLAAVILRLRNRHHRDLNG